MHVDDGAFTSLAELLLGTKTIGAIVTEPPENAEAPAAPDDIAVVALVDEAQALRDVRLFRARLADAFEHALATLVRECAYAVLGRELLLAPSDVAAIAARILAEHPDAQPFQLRAAPGDADVLASSATTLPPIVVDASLAPGDLVIAFASGEIDARLGTRVAALLGAPA